MHVQVNQEWLKIKVYNEVAEFLKHPCVDRKLQLQRLLAEYENIFIQLGGNNTSDFTDMEISMNNY